VECMRDEAFLGRRFARHSNNMFSRPVRLVGLDQDSGPLTFFRTSLTPYA
jgi:hypothetical protein